MKFKYLIAYTIIFFTTTSSMYCSEETDAIQTATSIRTMVNNHGNWGKECIDSLTQQFINQYQSAHSESAPVSLILTTQNGRKIRNPDGTITNDGRYLKITVLVSEKIFKQSVCEINEERIRSLSK